MLCLAVGELRPARGQTVNEPVRTVRFDAHGDPLPAGAVARLGTVRFREDGGRFRGHLCALAFSPDGKTLAAGHHEAIRLWNVATGKERCRFVPFSDGGTDSLAFSADGKTLAITNYHHETLHLWDVATRQQRHRFKIWGGPVAFSPDSKLVAAGSYGPRSGVYIGSVHLWDVATGKKVRQLTGHGERILGVAFSPDGRMLASTSGDKSIRLWDVATGKPLREIWGHTGWVYTVAFSPDGRTLASGSRDKTIGLWDVATGKELRRMRGHDGEVGTLLFSPDGRTLISSSWDRTTRRWDVATGKEIGQFGPPPTRVHNISAPLALSPDGKLLAGRGRCNNVVCLWDMATGKRVPSLPGHETPVDAVAVLPDGKTVISAGFDDEAARLWDVATGRQIGTLPGHRDGVAAMALSPDGTALATVSVNQRQLQLWDLAERRRLRQLAVQAPAQRAYQYQYNKDVAVAFSPDGKVLASGGTKGTIDFRDVETGAKMRPFRGPDQAVSALAFSPDGRYLATGHRRKFHIWEIATGRETFAYRPRSSNVTVSTMALSPDGRTLAVGCAQNRTFYPWDLATGQRITRFPANKGQGDAVTFSPDGTMLASAGRDGLIRIWEMATGRLFTQLPGHRARVTALAFLPDGRHLVSGSEDTTLLIWDLLDPQRRADDLKAGSHTLVADWNDLASPDSARAFRAMTALIHQPSESVPHLAKHLGPARTVDKARIEKLIADLDADQFKTRRAATAELASFGSSIAPRLRQVLGEKPSPEVRARLNLLLKSMSDQIPSGKMLRALRSITVLEHVHTSEARRLLLRLAAGDSSSRLTQLAKAAHQRMIQRNAARPE